MHGAPGPSGTTHRRSRHANTCVYESMFGNTRHVAEAISRGLESAGAVTAIPVARAGDEDLSGYDLVIVGGPTHVHGMSRESTRHGAAVTAHKPDSTVALEPDAESEGLREWLDGLPPEPWEGGGLRHSVRRPCAPDRPSIERYLPKAAPARVRSRRRVREFPRRQGIAARGRRGDTRRAVGSDTRPTGQFHSRVAHPASPGLVIGP